MGNNQLATTHEDSVKVVGLDELLHGLMVSGIHAVQLIGNLVKWCWLIAHHGEGDAVLVGKASQLVFPHTATQ